MESIELRVRRIGIVGLGLIGASVALAVRRASSTVWIGGVEQDGWPADAHQGLVNALCRTTDLRDADLVVLAAPVGANVAVLGELAAAGCTALVTDVGGTKRVMREAAEPAGAGLRYIGGHPMAGSEHSGPAHARADLFDDRPWFVVPGPGTAEADLARIEGFVRTLGARPICIDAETYDRLMAVVSHVPQIVASVLMEVLGEQAGRDGLVFAGQGLMDTTRLAAANSGWLPSVVETNAASIVPSLDAVIERLQAIRADIDAGRSTADLFERASAWRAVLQDTRTTP